MGEGPGLIRRLRRSLDLSKPHFIVDSLVKICDLASEQLGANNSCKGGLLTVSRMVPWGTIYSARAPTMDSPGDYFLLSLGTVIAETCNLCPIVIIIYASSTRYNLPALESYRLPLP